MSEGMTSVQRKRDRLIEKHQGETWTPTHPVYAIDPDVFYQAYVDYADGMIAADPYSTRDRYEIQRPELIRSILSDFNTRNYDTFIVLSGPLGTGKTTIMKIIHKLLMCNRVMSFKLAHSQRIVAKALEMGPRYLSGYTRCNLAINDFGMNDETIKHFGNDIDVLDQLVYRRFEQFGQPTFFTTNLTRDEFLSRFNQRTADRIENYMSWHKVVGPNYRKPLKSQ